MTHTRRNVGVCSKSTTVELSDNGTIETVTVTSGCAGNLTGLCRLLSGMPAQKALNALSGVECEGRGNSCPHQISLCLAEALAKQTS